MYIRKYAGILSNVVKQPVLLGNFGTSVKSTQFRPKSTASDIAQEDIK